ncbi:MAG: DUF504 domain-containing protein [Candidatus Hydrothermarchaeaceae archaeon]
MAKKVIDELKWHPEKSLEGVVITYLHRGAPGDVISVKAEELRFEGSFFVLYRDNRKTEIPYHRIVEIKKGSEILWKKR